MPWQWDLDVAACRQVGRLVSQFLSMATLRSELFLTASLDGTMRMWDMPLGFTGGPAQERGG